MSCIKCGRDHTDYHFRVLRVETLHIRDLDKERRVQALGDFEQYNVCKTCAEAKFHQDTRIDDRLRKKSLGFGLMIVLGAVIAALMRQDTPIFLFGIGLMVCGATCLYSAVSITLAKKRELSAMSREEAMYQCAWACLLDAAPKKNDINDITYIPVDEQTLARKNGDLMILYDLLPEIAVEAHKRIHEAS